MKDSLHEGTLREATRQEIIKLFSDFNTDAGSRLDARINDNYQANDLHLNSIRIDGGIRVRDIVRWATTENLYRRITQTCELEWVRETYGVDVGNGSLFFVLNKQSEKTDSYLLELQRNDNYLHPVVKFSLNEIEDRRNVFWATVTSKLLSFYLTGLVYDLAPDKLVHATEYRQDPMGWWRIVVEEIKPKKEIVNGDWQWRAESDVLKILRGVDKAYMNLVNDLFVGTGFPERGKDYMSDDYKVTKELPNSEIN